MNWLCEHEGYLSDTPAAEPAHKSAGHQLQEEEEDQSKVPVLASEAELKADLSRGVMTVFKTFKMQLEEHFTVSCIYILYV